MEQKVYFIQCNKNEIHIYYVLGDWNSPSILPTTWIADGGQEELMNKVINKTLEPGDFSIASGSVQMSSSKWSYTFYGAQLREISKTSDRNCIEINKEPDGFFLVKVFSDYLGEFEIDCIRYEQGV